MMPLVFRELHAAGSRDALNEEWLVLENTGSGPLNSSGCTLTVARNERERARPLGTLNPGFVLQPQERIRLVTGSPAKKSQGTPPESDKVRNYHLFLREPVLASPGLVLRIALNQMELAKAVFAPSSKDGIED
jgi:hypothetical protein